MTVKTIDGAQFAQMVLLGASHLSNNAQMIDALNVFPVPDGDTGTNMNLTMTSGANEVKKANTSSVGSVGESFAKGLLMGARGNSGVILSQLFRGFSKSVKDHDVLTVKDLADAFEAGVETAYKAVMKPVEGTILTVAKDAAKAAKASADSAKDIIELMENILKEAKESLNRTPELLPVLKEVGVVDSGGQGLVTVYEGFLASLKGEELPEQTDTGVSMNEMVNAEHHKMHQDFMDTSEIEFGYCTEFMVKFEEEKLAENPFDEEAFRNTLSEHGDSLLVVSDDEIVKVHVHAEYPGEVLNYGQKFGSLINLKIENMRQQHTDIVGDGKADTSKPQKEQAEYGIVTVAMGGGIKNLFESLGATVVIEGGQTMNPSTQDIAEAIQQANAKKVIVMPNNKNILMAAEQAVELSDSEVVVIPTKTVPQGMSALLLFHPEKDLEENKEAMSEAAQAVKTGQVTYAVRDTQIDGMTIEKGNYMGIADGKIKSTHQDKLEAIKELLNNMVDDDEDEIITILQGEEGRDEEVEQIEAFIEENFEDMEVEVHQGEQPIYSFIFSIE
ncbi:DAK2 domain-containing protein [Salinibacillus xinjiangensis]|uniref:DAK2 domain-containing protein n=1 Tax=Salinibacillus xinjiangensis TaxID=1229268 RepID=A0A6G1X388_9BACI|nr:DAK2 domain-containing protein [Salinibacillus xinjiangensis]MRG85441.1 DAK2 domain-containing protein [Salinibacillus xinjiangensis]